MIPTAIFCPVLNEFRSGFTNSAGDFLDTAIRNAGGGAAGGLIGGAASELSTDFLNDALTDALCDDENCDGT